jgi:pyruvate dehydrogenase E1 component
MAVIDIDATNLVATGLKSDTLDVLRCLDERLLWLASWTIHNANHLRESRDGLKAGGHQASCASMTTMMTALFFHTLRPQDRIAIKPHASPVLHAVEYLYGRQTQDQLERFRGFGGAQSYPSRTKDKIRVDFSTGSVGLGVAITAFASLVQDFLAARDWLKPEEQGRFISLLGDAELDEGNIYEALIEAYKHDIRNTWWIVDYNRQSLDATTTERMFDRFDDIFDTMGWDVITLKYGKAQREAFAKPGGEALRDWIAACPNDLYAALTYEGGAAWRERLNAELAGQTKTLKLIAGYSDEALADLMTRLGGHCLETLLAAFAAASAHDRPTLFIAYTIKGWRLPFQGHKDNHSGLMTPTQIEGLRDRLGVPEGQEWTPLGGVGGNLAPSVQRVLDGAPWAKAGRPDRPPSHVPIPSAETFPVSEGDKQSTQAAFGRILNDLSKRDDDFSNRLVTTSPDVTVSTNLGAFVNRRGLFARDQRGDVFKQRKIASPQTWVRSNAGQHIELGIAENNLFLMLGALGLSGSLFGERLFPIGTVYDPFIARGLDALNYACYQDARFILVATPSGLTLAPEGGAHQSINPPLIGMGQPGLTAWEPAFADELSVILHHAFEQIQAKDGASSYLRLSTRVIGQPNRQDGAWKADALKGAYWRVAPSPETELVIAYCGVLAPEAEEAFALIADDVPGAGLLAITSPDLLHRDWSAAGQARWTHGAPRKSHIEMLLSALPRTTGLVTMIDGSPSALSWLGGVCGHRVRALGVETFGQTGDLADLYHHYRLDPDAVMDAVADLLIRN